MPQRALHILHTASPALWGPGPAVSLVEASGTEILGSPHISTLLPKGSARVVSGYERPRPRWWPSTRDASTKMRQSPRGMPLLGHSAQGLHEAWEETGRLRAGGQVSPGPQRAGSHPPQEQVVCAVISAHGLAAATTPAAESEVLRAITTTDDQHFRPG